jgi:hypothetical protein
MDALRFTYVGPAGSEGALAEELRAQGAATVNYEASPEQRDLPAAEFVRVLFEVGGDASLIATVTTAARRITERFDDSHVEGLPCDDSDRDDFSQGEAYWGNRSRR